MAPSPLRLVVDETDHQTAAEAQCTEGKVHVSYRRGAPEPEFALLTQGGTTVVGGDGNLPLAGVSTELAARP